MESRSVPAQAGARPVRERLDEYVGCGAAGGRVDRQDVQRPVPARTAADGDVAAAGPAGAAARRERSNRNVAEVVADSFWARSDSSARIERRGTGMDGCAGRDAADRAPDGRALSLGGLKMGSG